MFNMYKTLDDLKRVISLGKPQSVIDKFSASYRLGVAMQPYLDAEESYSKLKSTVDKDNTLAVMQTVVNIVTPAVYDESDPENIILVSAAVTEEVEVEVSPEIDHNSIRDAAISVLEIEYPHLVVPDPEVIQVEETTWVDDVETVVMVDKELPIPSLSERRGVVEPQDELFVNPMILEKQNEIEIEKLDKVDRATLRLLMSLIGKLLTDNVIQASDFSDKEVELYTKVKDLKGVMW